MTGLRTISSDRLIDGEKIDNLPENTNSELISKEDKTNKGIAGGYASLGIDGKVPASELPEVFSGGDMEKSVYDPEGGNTQVAFKSDVESSLNDKVDKVVGKGLSTEDFTTADKEKLDSIDPAPIDLSGLVPYTGATSDVDLGINGISIKNESITGTAGTGFIKLTSQSSNPTPPAAGTLLIHASTNNGFTRMEQDNESTTNLVYGRDLAIIAKNTSGATLTKGTVVYITGSTGNVPNVGKAKADSATTLPAKYVVIDDIANNAFGQLMRKGIITGIDTSSYSSGDKIFVSPTTAGTFTNVRPSGNNFVQRVGTVLVSGVGNGSIEVDIAPSILNMETGTNAATFTAKRVLVDDDAYDSTTWNGSLDVPTKNAIRDKIESLGGGGSQTEPIADYSGQAVIGILGTYQFDATKTISKVSLSADSIPVGSNLIVEVRKNSTSTGNILSSTLQIATSDTLTNGKKIVSTTSFSSGSISSGDYITIVLTSVGSTTPAINPVCYVTFS